MKILAVITARGGSKRLHGKNIKPLGGKPLIAWSIDSARASGCCVDVLVSTDDPAIADVAKAYGASVPWLRPAELATDTAGSVDVMLHAVDWYEEHRLPLDGVLLLQPTSPFRSDGAIARAVDLFKSWQGQRPVVSVSPASTHPAWTFRVSGDTMSPFLDWDGLGKRSQDLEPAWMLNGSIYLIAPDQLRQDKSFLTPSTLPFQMQQAQEALDIDTATDFEMCEWLLDRGKQRPIS